MEIKLNFEKGNGLLPAIAQDWQTGQVLMMAFMNREAWEKTLATRKVHYWSRSRNELWFKGATSGNFQEVKEIFIDCDRDTILLKVEQLGGGACHMGYKSCFHQKIKEDGILEICGQKGFDPEEVYKK
ncbi:MAG: phosphoribosyl-AMP cyclohydrolase [Thermodesulfobacteriota bacterium]|jgi:phosphoribosyl-AMP cyclohydrolase